MKIKLFQKSKIKHAILLFFSFLLLTQEISSISNRFNRRIPIEEDEQIENIHNEKYIELPEELNVKEEYEEFINKEDRVNSKKK